MRPAHTSRNSVGHTNQAHTKQANHTEQVGSTQWGKEDPIINRLHCLELITHPTQPPNIHVPRRTLAYLGGKCVHTPTPAPHTHRWCGRLSGVWQLLLQASCVILNRPVESV